MKLSQQEILEHEQSGPWRELLARAQSMVKDAEGIAGGLPMNPVLGGGTRLMLAIHHRLSDDIDLFIRDPQWIGYLTPRLNENVVVDAYEENATSLKLKYPIGEIDFIVAMSLLGLPDDHAPGLPFKLEPIAEVLAKKLFYRGSLMTPRDLFDWWAIEQLAPNEVPHDQMALLLKVRLDGIDNALNAMSLSPAAQTIWDALRTPLEISLPDAIAFGQQQISFYRNVLSLGQTASP